MNKYIQQIESGTFTTKIPVVEIIEQLDTKVRTLIITPSYAFPGEYETRIIEINIGEDARNWQQQEGAECIGLEEVWEGLALNGKVDMEEVKAFIDNTPIEQRDLTLEEQMAVIERTPFVLQDKI